MGPFSQHVLLQLVDIWYTNGEMRDSSPVSPPQQTLRQTHSPSNLPEKLSVARQRFFFRPLFLASGMSMGWLEGMSAEDRDPDLYSLAEPAFHRDPVSCPLCGYSPGRASHSGLKSVSPCWVGSKEKASSKGLCPCWGEYV